MPDAIEFTSKPSMHDLWMKHHFDYQEVDIKAVVPRGTTYAMVERRPVQQTNAGKVLAALSDLYHYTYNLENVEVTLQPEEV